MIIKVLNCVYMDVKGFFPPNPVKLTQLKKAFFFIQAGLQDLSTLPLGGVIPSMHRHTPPASALGTGSRGGGSGQPAECVLPNPLGIYSGGQPKLLPGLSQPHFCFQLTSSIRASACLSTCAGKPDLSSSLDIPLEATSVHLSSFLTVTISQDAPIKYMDFIPRQLDTRYSQGFTSLTSPNKSKFIDLKSTL